MDITFACESCGQQIVVDEAGAGLATDCPKCGQPITVPSPTQVQVEPPTTPSQSVGLHETKKCPFCAETIKREAIVCKHCGRDLVAKRLPAAVAEKVQGPAKFDVPTVGLAVPERAKLRIGLRVILAVAFVVGGLWLYQSAHRLSVPDISNAQPMKLSIPDVSKTQPMKFSVREVFRTQLMKFIEEGTKINSMSSLGVSYADFKNQVATAQSSYGLALATWPEGFAAGSKEQFAKAVDGWRLTLKLWELKLKWDEDSAGLRQEDKAGLRMYYCPTEPDQYGYKDFIAYAGDKLAILKHRDDERTPELSGKKFLPQDENISVLLDVAGAHFAIGASLAMADLPQ